MTLTELKGKMLIINNYTDGRCFEKYTALTTESRIFIFRTEESFRFISPLTL